MKVYDIIFTLVWYVEITSDDWIAAAVGSLGLGVVIAPKLVAPPKIDRYDLGDMLLLKLLVI